MHTINTLFGKPIIVQTSGTQLATIQDIVLDQAVTRVVAFLIDGVGWLRHARVIRWEQIVSLGDVVLIRTEQSATTLADDPEITALATHIHQITGTTIITIDGTELGTVADLVINDQGQITGYMVKQGFFEDLGGRSILPAAQVRAVGDDAVMVTDPRLAAPGSTPERAASD